MGSKKDTSKETHKREARQKVYARLAAALAEFKVGIKEKKFEKKLRKASKLFTVDILKASKERGKTPKIPKKKTETTTVEHVQKSA